MFFFSPSDTSLVEPTVHVDAFLYDEDFIDSLWEGKMSRNYCMAYGSHRTAPLGGHSSLQTWQRVCTFPYMSCYADSWPEHSLFWGVLSKRPTCSELLPITEIKLNRNIVQEVRPLPCPQRYYFCFLLNIFNTGDFLGPLKLIEWLNTGKLTHAIYSEEIYLYP